MNANFAGILVKDMSMFYRGSFKEKTRSITRTGYIEFSSSDVRNVVWTKIEGSGVKCQHMGKGLDIKRATPPAAAKRNKALASASDLLKKQAGIQDADVVIQWTGERGVTVKNIYAFTQPPGDSLGAFTGTFSGLALPNV